MIIVEELTRLGGVRHAFFSRHGGASSGLYGSNNCAFGSSDDPAVVERNRAACANHLGLAADRLVTVKQRHTPDVVVVDRPWDWHNAPTADALVTRESGLALGILTADCVPILLADGENRVIGAAHAGWKGAFDGVIQATIAAMVRLGARVNLIAAAVGPAIGPKSYEVGPEFRDRFIQRDSGHERYFAMVKPNGHSHFDLIGFVGDALRNAGIGVVAGGRWDTCADPAQFFSYRRSVLAKEPDYGRQLSAIALSDGER